MNRLPKANLPKIRQNLVDKLVNYVNPVQGARRLHARSMTAAYNMFSSQGYITFGSRRPSMRGAQATANSADVDTVFKLNAMRASCRDLYMNAPVASAALKRARTNIVGFGLALQSRPDAQVLGITEQQAEDWARKTEREFALWAESKYCDVTRTQTFYELQGLALMATLMSGDCFTLLPFINDKNHPYDLRIKIIEGDFVSNPNNIYDTDICAGGIEVDENGAPVKYWIQKKHPGSINPSWEWVPVPVFGAESGRRNALHIFDRERPGQRRGVPMLAPVVETLKQITRLSESELMASVVSSFFTAFISTEAADPMQGSVAPGDSILDKSNPSDNLLTEMGHGSIVELKPGEKIDLADPRRPNGNFAPFFEAMIRQIGACIEQPYELLMLSFTSSYSASRGAMLEAWKSFRQKRAWLTREFCRPIYEEWLTEAIVKGRVIAPGFFLDPSIRQAWCESHWAGPGQGQLDPMSETSAALLAIEGNISTHVKEAARMDGDYWPDMINVLARERKIIIDKGLIPYTKSASKEPVANSDQSSQPARTTPDKKTITIPTDTTEEDLTDE